MKTKLAALLCALVLCVPIPAFAADYKYHVTSKDKTNWVVKERMYNDMRKEQANQIYEQLCDMREAKAAAETAYCAVGGGLTPQSGINYYGGRREAYYSSNVLYHYRTSEWRVDKEGFYRDAKGRYVVAASDIPFGSTFQGSKGTCIVLDSGCAPGTTDYYVKW